MRFIETMRVENGQILNLALHKDRAQETMQFHFGIEKRLAFELLVNEDINGLKGIFKLRVIYSKNIEEFKIEPYVPRMIKKIKMVNGGEIDYRFKYEDRSAIERLLALKEDCDDILIVKHGFVTDTSYTNVVFAEGKKLFTPSTYLLNGIKRQHLLKEGVIKERVIRAHDIKGFDRCFLINAMLDLPKVSAVVINDLLFC